MELSKNYQPENVEEKWYKHWLEKGYFSSTPDDRKPFTVVIPPPNVTGVLHMGHTLNETVQDILVRRARMMGYNTCWVPGSDHASIATEAKVVQMLKEKGVDKNSITREEFLNYAFEWKEKYGSIIYHQIAKLGCSVDWARASFTMDDHYYRAVIRVFNKLYKKGWIYRGARMINWDPAAKTALSDEEVEYKDVEGTLYYIKYRITDPEGEEFVTIATQRPETIMGDTAVCANPADVRYKALKGKKVFIPLIDKEIPVIFDDYVDKEFGTGILKITPAHDINDYNIGLRHNLAVVDTLNDDGTLSEAAKIYVGEDRFAVRKKIIEDLKQEGLLVREEKYQTRLGYSQRTNAVAEPKISTQWFLKMREMAKPALEAVTKGKVNIHPGDKFFATYKYWLENVTDWCISRQLWWGQQIPAWYDDENNIYVAESEEDALLLAKKGKKVKGDINLRRDVDVLDTWFSSWLWPIEVFKGITNPGNKDISYYYPTSVLVTGQDIIFFWVARMIMAGMEFMDEKPFSDVYFTGMVRDKLGRKMSKQLGNSPDLLQLIEKYGADAVRFGIMISSPAGNDLLFDEASLEQGKYFNNKMWNALKLIKSWETRQDMNASQENHFAVEWFQNRLSKAKGEVDRLLSDFKLSESLKIIYSLIWDDYCSWFLEWIKPDFEGSIAKKHFDAAINYFEQLLQLLHPYMPFVTEEIFHLLRTQENDLVITQFDKPREPDAKILHKGQKLQELITTVRDSRNKNNIKNKIPVSLHIDAADKKSIEAFRNILQKQTNASSVEFTNVAIPGAITLVAGTDKIYLTSSEQADPEVQKQQLMKDLEYLKGFLNSVDKKLSNNKFVENAKPEVIDLERKKKADTEEKIRLIEQSLASII